MVCIVALYGIERIYDTQVFLYRPCVVYSSLGHYIIIIALQRILYIMVKYVHKFQRVRRDDETARGGMTWALFTLRAVSQSVYHSGGTAVYP